MNAPYDAQHDARHTDHTPSDIDTKTAEADTRIWRGERKTPGGKLVAVNVWREPAAIGHQTGGSSDAALDTTGPTPSDAGRLRCRIDGDFFIEAADDADARTLLHAIERALEHGEDPARAIAAHPRATLVGTDAHAIAQAWRRALAAMRADLHRTSVASAETPEPASDGGPYAGPSSAASDDATTADAVSGAGMTGTTSDASGPKSDTASDAASVSDDEADFDARWRRLLDELVVVHDHPRPPKEQMATDERWAREVAAGERPATLRVWEWDAPCVVVGRFQSIPDEVHEDEAAREGIEVVRRCTGGGAMFIEPGNTITYSLYAPMWFVDGVDVAASYRLCDRWLVRALRSLGLDVRFAGLNDIASQHGKIGGAAQRRFPAGSGTRGGGGVGAGTGTGGEAGAGTSVGAVTGDRAVIGTGTGDRAGIGTGGEAGNRTGAGTSSTSSAHGTSTAPGAVLHHVTMAYDIDAVKMTRVLNVSGEKTSDKAVKSAVKRVDPMRSQTGMGRGEIIDHLLKSLRGK